MMSLVYVRGLDWSVELAAIPERFDEWLAKLRRRGRPERYGRTVDPPENPTGLKVDAVLAGEGGAPPRGSRSRCNVGCC